MPQAKTVDQVTSTLEAWIPVTEAERRILREQLERILANPKFGKSKRCPCLFRYVVERTLEGDAGRLKERTLGVEVFGRDPFYDTNLDPVVRMTAGEVRKRIAQYYHEPGHEGEIRIDLPTGSYVPEFRLLSAPPIVESSRARWKALPIALIAVVIAVAAALAFWQKPWTASSALESFWQPVIDSGASVLICVGPADRQRSTMPLPAGPGADPGSPAKAPTLGDVLRYENVSLADATTLARVSSFLGTRGKTIRVQSMASTTFKDLRVGPDVLIGAFNNDWTMRITRQLRYGFEMDAGKNAYRLIDREHPEQNNIRGFDLRLPYQKLAKDYAVVARFMDPLTERVVVVAAGVGQYGTLAAGEFLTNAKYIEALTSQLPAGWQRKNVEAVIVTRVIDGDSGPPRVVANYVW